MSAFLNGLKAVCELWKTESHVKNIHTFILYNHDDIVLYLSNPGQKCLSIVGGKFLAIGRFYCLLEI